jgi:peptidoglycan/LPS O-acetylase OafA/YrhL
MATTPLARSALHVVLATAALLLVPAVAMQFTAEVAWGAGDFAAGAALLFAAGVACARGSRRRRSAGQRVAIGLLVFGALGVVRAEPAVDVFG